MSYGNYGGYEKAPQRKGSGGKFFLILLLMVAGFFIFKSMQNQAARRPVDEGTVNSPRDWNEPALPGESSEQRGSIYGERQAEMPEAHPDRDDWNMEEVESARSTRNAENPIVKPDSKSSSKGDWSIEEVDSNSKKTNPTFKVTAPTESAAPKSKSTKSGDWELEEVDKKDKS